MPVATVRLAAHAAWAKTWPPNALVPAPAGAQAGAIDLKDSSPSSSSGSSARRAMSFRNGRGARLTCCGDDDEDDAIGAVSRFPPPPATNPQRIKGKREREREKEKEKRGDTEVRQPSFSSGRVSTSKSD